MNTLPDYVAPGLRLLSIGLNPSIPSVEAGYYFANPRNRFWRALNASRLVAAPADGGPDAVRRLFEQQRIGFTDLVKRPTRGAAELRVADFRQGAQRLLALLEDSQPECAWFHGKLAYNGFIRYGLDLDQQPDWGLQPVRIGVSRCFVTPNPSPANAAFSLQDLVDWYDRLAERIRPGR